MAVTGPPRLLPDEPLPPYTYVPGRFPHPVSDPAGHSFGAAAEPVPTLAPERFAESRAYLRGIDLFNHGYYWEAHEALEQLWHAAGRRGPTAMVLQGLIKLAAAGVKAREGRRAGTERHAAGARALFERAAGELGTASHAGLRFADLLAHADQAAHFGRDAPDDEPGVLIVFPFILHPRAEERP
jgi:predicted metal-dependent hydrolase